MTTNIAQRSEITLRLCRLICFALWVLILTPCRLFAQTTTDQSSVADVVPPSPTSGIVDFPAPPTVSTPPIVRGPCDPDYWIVSTRKAKCEIESGLPCRYEVLRFDGQNPARYTTMDELLASLQPTVPVCFMAHGSFVTWDSMLADSANTYRWLRQAAPDKPLHVIFYTWASRDSDVLPHIKVNKLGRRSSLNGFYLADVVSKVSADHPVCLIGHSHGTRLVSAALHSMAGGVVDQRRLASGPLPLRRLRVVFAAAAIDHDWLNPNEKYGLALCPTEAFINLQNQVDFPLMFYPFRYPISKRALAITGVTPHDRNELGWSAAKVVNYDVTDMVGVGHIWSHYYHQPTIATAIRHYVYFDE